MKLIAPSILSADLSNLRQSIKYVEIGKADFIHCDIMDGLFVPNITFGPIIVASVKKITNIPLDVHLMIEKPDRYIENFAAAGASIITIHQEAERHLHRSIEKIKSCSTKAGVSINPATPVSTLENILEFVDLVLIMSVNPGFGGQKFIQSSIAKIKLLNELRIKNNYQYLIEIDGGITHENIKLVADAGCDIFVAGSSIFSADNISAAAIELKLIANG